MPHLFTITPRRLAANKENAQKSTGPKTAAGKAKSAKNASTHTIYSPHLLQEGESRSDFLHFRYSLLKDLCPQNFLELAHAERIIALHWKLRRLQAAENQLNQMQNILYRQRLKDEQEQAADKRDRFIADCEKFKIPYTDEDLAEQGLDPDAPPPEPPPGFFIAESLHNSHEESHRHTSYERLLNAETKLQSLLSKANKDYRQTQQDRIKQEATQDENTPEPFCLFAIEPPKDDAVACDSSHHENEDDEDNEATTPSPTMRHTAQQGATTPTKKNQNKPTCQNDTLSPLARAAASATHQMIDQQAKGAYDTP